VSGYRVGRHNDELIYWQPTDQPSDDDMLRYVVVSGPSAELVCQALNTEQSQAILQGRDVE
jgi:hypothetical protein